MSTRQNAETILEKAIQSKPQDRFLLIEGLIQSLDKPDKELDELWACEAEKRLQAYREGKTKGIPFEDVFLSFPRSGVGMHTDAA